MSQPTRIHMSLIISECDVSEHAKHFDPAENIRPAATFLFQDDVRLIVIQLQPVPPFVFPL